MQPNTVAELPHISATASTPEAVTPVRTAEARGVVRALVHPEYCA